jgi:peroxiredoxin
MAALPPLCDFGWKAPAFNLSGVDGKSYALESLRGPNGTLIAFICNHCPYVKTGISRLVRDATELQGLGVTTVAICSNDPVAYPADNFDNMKSFAKQHGFTFPYLHDATQEVAAPMRRSAPRIFSASTASSNCSTADALMNRKP